MSQEQPLQQEDLVDVWDNVAKYYSFEDYWADPASHAWLGRLRSHIGEPSGQRVLEVGCGSGLMSLALAQQGACVSLLDISPVALQRAREVFAAKHQPIPTCYRADALHSGIAENSFDVTWNCGVIEHFTNEGKRQLVMEMVKMTKPGGKVIIMVPNRWCWPFQIGQAYMKLRRTWPYGNEDDMSPMRLKRLCRRLDVEHYDAYSFDPVLGWYWLPFLGARLKRCLGPRPVEKHMQRSIIGWMSVLVIEKS